MMDAITSCLTQKVSVTVNVFYSSDGDFRSLFKCTLVLITWMSNPTRPQANNHANLAHFLSRIGVGPSDAIPPGDCSPSQIVPSPPTTFLQAAFSVVRCAGREQNMMTMGRAGTFRFITRPPRLTRFFYLSKKNGISLLNWIPTVQSSLWWKKIGQSIWIPFHIPSLCDQVTQL